MRGRAGSHLVADLFCGFMTTHAIDLGFRADFLEWLLRSTETATG